MRGKLNDHLVREQRFSRSGGIIFNNIIRYGLFLYESISIKTVDEKLLPFAGPLLDHIGGLDGMYSMIDNGQLELQHLGYIRGRDIRDSIIIASEAENFTIQHIQLLIGRVGEGSQLWLDGDHKQVDKQVFRDNSGLSRCIERLAGQHLFGYVDLPTTERSETAKLADLLD